MERIIASRFETKTGADTAALALAQHIDADDICILVSDPSAPPSTPTAENTMADKTYVDPHSEGAAESAMGTAAAGGLVGGVIGAFGGPVIALAGAGTGAYLGALLGALNGLGKHEEASPAAGHRLEGVVLLVRIVNPDQEANVLDTLQLNGATEIESGFGQWQGGEWAGFSPVPVKQLAESPLSAQSLSAQ